MVCHLGKGVNQHAQFMFVSLAPHLINDESEVGLKISVTNTLKHRYKRYTHLRFLIMYVG